jgi:hypothetical protein
MLPLKHSPAGTFNFSQRCKRSQRNVYLFDMCVLWVKECLNGYVCIGCSSVVLCVCIYCAVLRVFREEAAG